MTDNARGRRPALSRQLDALYGNRFSHPELGRKDGIWQVLCADFFQAYVQPSDLVLDVGAGHCEFINHIRGRGKIALDLSDLTARYAAPDVQVLQSASHEIGLATASVDAVFMSNFLEHLSSKAVLLQTLSEIHRLMTTHGRLLILQPNIRLVGSAYWDFIDHILPLTEGSLVEALHLTGFTIEVLRVRFLPYTTKSRFPQAPALVRLYLRLPPAQWLLGKQTFVVARKGQAG